MPSGRLKSKASTSRRSQMPVEAEEINLLDILRILSSYWSLILGCTLGCVLAAGLYAAFWPKTYEAITTLKVSMPVKVVESENIARNLIQELHLADRGEFKGLGESDLVKKLVRTVLFKNEGYSNILTIQVHAHDPQLASELANAWAENFIQINLEVSREPATVQYNLIEKQIEEMERGLKEKLQNKINNPDSIETQSDRLIYNRLIFLDMTELGATESADPAIVVTGSAGVPQKPIEPKVWRALIFGLGMGLFAGVLIGFGLDSGRRTKKLRKHQVSS